MKSMPSPVEALKEGQSSGKTKPQVKVSAAPAGSTAPAPQGYYKGMLSEGVKAMKASDCCYKKGGKM